MKNALLSYLSHRVDRQQRSSIQTETLIQLGDAVITVVVVFPQRTFSPAVVSISDTSQLLSSAELLVITTTVTFGYFSMLNTFSHEHDQQQLSA